MSKVIEIKEIKYTWTKIRETPCQGCVFVCEKGKITVRNDRKKKVKIFSKTGFKGSEK